MHLGALRAKRRRRRRRNPRFSSVAADRNKRSPPPPSSPSLSLERTTKNLTNRFRSGTVLKVRSVLVVVSSRLCQTLARPPRDRQSRAQSWLWPRRSDLSRSRRQRTRTWTRQLRGGRAESMSRRRVDPKSFALGRARGSSRGALSDLRLFAGGGKRTRCAVTLLGQSMGGRRRARQGLEKGRKSFERERAGESDRDVRPSLREVDTPLTSVASVCLIRDRASSRAALSFATGNAATTGCDAARDRSEGRQTTTAAFGDRTTVE